MLIKQLFIALVLINACWYVLQKLYNYFFSRLYKLIHKKEFIGDLSEESVEAGASKKIWRLVFINTYIVFFGIAIYPLTGAYYALALISGCVLHIIGYVEAMENRRIYMKYRDIKQNKVRDGLNKMIEDLVLIEKAAKDVERN